jgi:hypothetical protein
MKTPDEWVTWAAPWSQKSSGDLKRAIVERDRAHERDAAGLRRLVEEAQAERDRLKGDLAESRRLLDEIPGTFAPGGWIKRRDAFLAATPAEQAQGEAAKPKSSQSKYPCQFDSEGRCEWHVHDDKPLMLAVAEVAKRVEALESWRNVAAPPPPPDYSHHHTFRQWEREGWPDRCGVRVREGDDPFCCQPADWYGHIKPAPPPPEAAGPGHVFSCDVAGKDDGECDDSCICEVCDVRFDCHAVPPIAGGANP